MRQTILIAIASILAGVLFWPAFKFALVKWDTDPNYGHAFLVPPAALYLAWRNRDAIQAARKNPSALGLLLFLPAIGLHIIACNAGLMRFSMVGFVGVLAGAIIIFWGPCLLRVLAPALFLLMLSIPIPLYLESVTLPMKLIASAISSKVIGLFGISIYREGTIIYLSNMTLEVATACSGLRSLVLVFTVGTFYAYVTQENIIKQWIIILLSFPIAIGANVARIVVTALLSNVLSSERTQHLVHDFSGFFVFIVAGITFVILGSLLDVVSKKEATVRKEPEAAESTT